MVKLKKTYRLNQLTVDQIQEIRSYYSQKGLDLTDGQIVQKAIDNLIHSIYQKKISDAADQADFSVDQ